MLRRRNRDVCGSALDEEPRTGRSYGFRRNNVPRTGHPFGNYRDAAVSAQRGFETDHPAFLASASKARLFLAADDRSDADQ